MSTFIDRLRAEHDELLDKEVKLDSFVKTGSFYNLPVEDKDLLMIQLGTMKQYRTILHIRLVRLTK